MPSFLSVLIAQTDNERRSPPVSLSATQNDFVLHLAPHFPRVAFQTTEVAGTGEELVRLRIGVGDLLPGGGRDRGCDHPFWVMRQSYRLTTMSARTSHTV